MADHTEIEVALQEVCNCAVKALRRFSHLTDLEPTRMHESFMASFVFDRLGENRSMAPELMASTIWEWNHHQARPMPAMPSGVQAQQRVDLTLFYPQEVAKSAQHPWCFIEFKRNWSGVEADYWKLKSLTGLLECPFGATCAIVSESELSVRSWLEDEARKLGEHFVVSRQWDYKGRAFVVAGYLFARAATAAVS